MAVSDVLYEAEEAIREYQREGFIARPGEPELELVIAVMRAVRMMPGRDMPPGYANNFVKDLTAALVRYRDEGGVITDLPPTRVVAMSRQLLNWNRSKYLRIAKMLAWVIKDREGANEQRLWQRMDVLYKPVCAKVVGVGISWTVAQRYTLMKQGAPITPNKLAQRADKAERYCEFTPEKDAVVAAYESLRE